MRFLKYLLVIVATVLVTLGCVYGFSCVSCDGCGDSERQTSGEAPVQTVRTLSSDDGGKTGQSADEAEADAYLADEEEEYEGSPQWLVVTFDAVVIALSVGVVILVWWLYRRFVKNLGKRNRRFG